MKREKDSNVNPEETPQTPEAAAPEQPEKAAEPAEVPAEEAPQADLSQWQAALETAVKQRDEYLDSLRRTQADFQNFRRRNQTARSDGYQDACCDVIEAILPTIDNLERALGAVDAGDKLA